MSDDHDDDTHDLRPTRRQTLGGTAGLIAAALGIDPSTAQEAIDATGGSLMALTEATNVAGDLYVGPDSAKGTVTPETGRVYKAVDTGAEYYADGSSWTKQPVDAPSVQTEEIANVYDAIVSPGNATDLQNKHDNASQGERIAIPPGDYQEQLTVRKGVILEGISVSESQESGNNIFATDALSSESVVIGNPNTADPDIDLAHGSSAIQGLELRNIGLTSNGAGVQTVKGTTNDDPRLHDFLFERIYGVGMGIGEPLIDLSNAAEGTIHRPRGHDLGTGIRLETEDNNVNYGLISIESPRIDINKENGTDANSGFRFNAISGATIDGIFLYGSPVHVGSQNNSASNFYGINATNANGLNFLNLRAEGPDTLVKARSSRLGIAQIGHITSDVTIDDDNPNTYSFVERSIINRDSPAAGGVMPQPVDRPLFTGGNGPWKFNQVDAPFYDDFGDNGFSSRTDRYQGYARLSDNSSVFLDYRAPWTATEGSPSVSSNQLVLPNNSNAHEAINDNAGFTEGTWVFEWNNATSPTSGFLEFRIMTDGTNDNSIYAINAPGNDDWTIYKQDGGSRSQLATTTGATTDTNTHKLYFSRTRDGRLTLAEDSTELLTTRDDFVPSVQRIAVKTSSGYDADVQFPSIKIWGQ